MRYPWSLSLHYSLDPAAANKIFIPYLKLEYRELRIDLTNSYLVNTSVSTVYSASTVAFWKAALAFFVLS